MKPNLRMAYLIPLFAVALSTLSPIPVHAASQTLTVHVQLTYSSGVPTPGFVTIEYGCMDRSFTGIWSENTMKGFAGVDGGVFTPTCGASTQFGTWLHIYAQAQEDYGAIYFNGVPSDGNYTLSFVLPLNQTTGRSVHV